MQHGNSRAFCYDPDKNAGKDVFSSSEFDTSRSAPDQNSSSAAAAAAAANVTQQTLMTMVRVMHCNCRVLTWLR